MASRRARGSRLAAVLAAAAAAAALGGCATGPANGTPEAIQGASSQVQAYVQPLPPPPPGKNWNQVQVVQGFVRASASYAFDPAAARAYLTPQERAIWRPGQVNVVSRPTTYLPAAGSQPPHALYRSGLSAPESATVDVTGVPLATPTLTASGQNLYAGGPKTYPFTLALVNGVWLISILPDRKALLLTASDFQWAYQPRNLFFLSAAGTVAQPALVPDPVYAPLQSASSALNTNLATGLVRGLLNSAPSWLQGATSTAFPRGTTLLGQVTISRRTATVDLGGAAATADRASIGAMADQILETLSNTAYSPAIATSVVLQTKGRVRVMQSGEQEGELPPLNAGRTLYLQTGPSRVSTLVPTRTATPRAAPPSPVVLPAEINGATITALAASVAPDVPKLAIATRAGQGCAVYFGNIDTGRNRPYPGRQLSRSGGPCTSLSWDIKGYLWAVAGQRIWVFPPQERNPVAVSLPSMSSIGQPISRILELRMAPDGVRAALLVTTKAGNRLILAAVTHQGTGESLGPAVAAAVGLMPVSVSWYDDYNLVALANSEIIEVPLTGAAGTELASAPAGAQSLTTNGQELVVGTGRGQIWTSANSANLSRSILGAIPTYSG